MNSSRLKQLFEFLSKEPNDPFILYAIATEYRDLDIEKARKYYQQLLDVHPDYLPTYYHAAHLFIDLQEDELAKATFLKGITLAQKQEDHMALRELKNAYNEFLFDD